MDVSSEYVKMCEKAVEIQALAPKPTILGGNFWHYPEGATGAPIVWLPRQDQLQAMVHPSDCTYAISYCLLDNFIHWYQARCYDELAMIYSMEQLWLAFVYKQKYNKVWGGKEWITS
jgi:hypothetical protein